MTRRACSLLDFRQNPILLAAGLAALAVPMFGQGAAPARAAAHEPAQDIAGAWQGTLHAGMDMRVVATISATGNGTYKALLYEIIYLTQGVSMHNYPFWLGSLRDCLTLHKVCPSGRIGAWDKEAEKSGYAAWRLPAQGDPVRIKPPRCESGMVLGSYRAQLPSLSLGLRQDRGSR